MAGDAGRLVAERQECRDWPIPAEPAAEEFGGEQELGEGASEGEGNAGRRGSDAQAIQGNAPGDVQAGHRQVTVNFLPTSLFGTAFPFAQNHAQLAGPSPTESNAEAESPKARP